MPHVATELHKHRHQLTRQFFEQRKVANSAHPLTDAKKMADQAIKLEKINNKKLAT